MCETGKPFYLLVPSEEIKLEKNEIKIKGSLRENQQLLLGRCDVVTCFKRRNGEIVKSDIPATYSWKLVAQQN